jgi:hypothetical protein
VFTKAPLKLRINLRKCKTSYDRLFVLWCGVVSVSSNPNAEAAFLIVFSRFIA